MDNPFSWDYLTTTPGSNEVFGPFAVIFLLVFGIGFALSAVIYGGGARSLIPDPVIRRMARRWSGWAMSLFGVGLFFFAIRWLQINPLSFGMRIWLWLCWLALFAFAAYVIYDGIKSYGAAKLAFEEHRRKQQYLRPGSAGVPTSVRATAPGAPGTPAPAGPRQVRRKKR